MPDYGIFVKEQIDAVGAAGVQTDIVFINGRMKGKRAYLEAVPEIRRRAKDVDVIHCHHLYSGLATFLAMTGKPTVLSFLNDWLYELDEVKSIAIRRALCSFGARWASRVIFKSPVPPQFVGNPKFLYLPNGANSSQFHITPRLEARAALGLDPDKNYLLFVSSKDRDRPQKRYDRFQATVELLRDVAPELNVEELVLVNQPRERVLNFFNGADIHLMTSDYEGSPNSVKEALCCGLAVVSTKVGNVEDLLARVPGCHVAALPEPAQLAELVRRSLSSAVPREVIREAFLVKDFSQEAVTLKLVATYEFLSRKRDR
ncbi:MAG: glycosyltransferase family 4 protein [Acidimicrobiales bacterium]|nr:glycosyltransferase family 4 protein [Acidimicrobiales bacterium]